MHRVYCHFKLINIDLELRKSQPIASFLQIALDNLLLCQTILKEAVDVFGQVVSVLLEEHREAVFDTLSMIKRVYR